jgi:hypothetical protein
VTPLAAPFPPRGFLKILPRLDGGDGHFAAVTSHSTTEFTMPLERSIHEMLDTVTINKRLATIEKLLSDHAAILDKIYELHGQRHRHQVKTKRAMLR